jgi:hypothetical protein
MTTTPDKPYVINNFLSCIAVVSEELHGWAIKELALGYKVEELKCRLEDAIKASGRT